MKFKNKSNGLVFDVVHEDTIKRLQKDENYEIVKEKQKTKKTDTKTDDQKSITKKKSSSKSSKK